MAKTLTPKQVAAKADRVAAYQDRCYHLRSLQLLKNEARQERERRQALAKERAAALLNRALYGPFNQNFLLWLAGDVPTPGLAARFFAAYPDILQRTLLVA